MFDIVNGIVFVPIMFDCNQSVQMISYQVTVCH